MPFSKRHVTTRDLLGEYLTYTPGVRDTELLYADLRAMNPTLLADAIREATAVRRRAPIPPGQQRRAVHQIYARKVKELSSLYPFVFAVENGLRSALADHSTAKFGRVDWWTLIRDGRDAGKDHTAFPHIATVPVSSAFVQSVFQAFANMGNPAHQASMTGPDRTDEFYYTLSLGDLWKILRKDWSLTRGMFCSDREMGLKFDKNAFDDTMRVIKDARNEIFHSNPIKHRSTVVEACERILNGLNVHLGDFDVDLGAAQAGRVVPSVARTARHLVPAR